MLFHLIVVIIISKNVKIDSFTNIFNTMGGFAIMSTVSDFLWDRGNEIQCIETYLKTPPSRFTPNIHYFCGMSGVGKTRLFEYASNYMKSVLPSQSIESVALYFDYTFPDNRETEENIVRNIYNRLRKEKFAVAKVI